MLGVTLNWAAPLSPPHETNAFSPTLYFTLHCMHIERVDRKHLIHCSFDPDAMHAVEFERQSVGPSRTNTPFIEGMFVS